MSNTKTFYLPDLGEGLPDATIVEWFVKVGDVIRLDEPLVSMETAKAVVEVPSPVSGKVLSLAGKAGDIVVTGTMLAEFEPDPNLPQRAEGQDTGHHHGAPKTTTPTPVDTQTPEPVASAERDDAGTVVGAMQSSNEVHSEQAVSVGGVKAMPAVRALAKKLGLELARIPATGTGGVVTLADVKKAAANPALLKQSLSNTISAASAAVSSAISSASAVVSSVISSATESVSVARTTMSAAGKPMRTQPPSIQATGQPEPLKGVRRNMARVMADAHSKVVLTTLNDDADIAAWNAGQDMTTRLIRAMVAACQSVPALNAWFDGENLTRTLHPHVDIGIAVDTDDGLFVPALRNAHVLDAKAIRYSVNRLRQQVEDRSIPSSELSGYTISLSNFGMFAGRYATPIVVPPCVAIVGAGRARFQMTPVMGGVESHKIIPLSLSFDHRACTGGEAARFLRAMLDDLALAD